MSRLGEDYRRLGRRVADALDQPVVDGLYLPPPVADETFRDEFGFVFLDDGSVGPFYVSMGGILRALWDRHPDPAAARGDPLDLLEGLASPDLAGRALALGVYNALSAALYRRAGCRPPARKADDPVPGSLVGMVGYFSPVIDRLTARGCRVRVLELSPERVPDRPGVSRAGEAAELRDCDRVICTASVLINDTLDHLLAALEGRVPVELIGPSGSGLPDALFARGIRAIGGSLFDSREALIDQLRRGEPWGRAARKFQLDADEYPGIEHLIARLHDG